MGGPRETDCGGISRTGSSSVSKEGFDGPDVVVGELLGSGLRPRELTRGVGWGT